ncbi:hypothetical protein [Thermomonospora umbrina]|uniref:Uncharacterized protein n=1 Tax=Thermomonospora umbrina TaxID=111806 RepID=A0A3D9SM50_9ACTN|nr:hypothetical protein [Thermomonospora umbrina]REE97006.1 hypothetical protein DFJ69_2461 [Thermomonospora umbrina]
MRHWQTAKRWVRRGADHTKFVDLVAAALKLAAALVALYVAVRYGR